MNNSIRWTNYIVTRLIQRNISMEDVISAIKNGEIIENYPMDYPNPSCLVLGIIQNEKAIHVVCGLDEENLWLITAYCPSLDEWKSDFKTRREFL